MGGNLAMWAKYSNKECFYHIIKYTSTNMILNKNLAKFLDIEYRSTTQMKEHEIKHNELV